MDYSAHLDQLAPELRLALAYAPTSVLPQTLGLFALDARLAGIVRSSREPLLAQVRLGWWREQLTLENQAQVHGEPLLALLATWGDKRGDLVVLVDGWEGLVGEAPLSEQALSQFVEARASACAALAQRLGAASDAAEAERAGRSWAAADLAARLSHADEQASAKALLQAIDGQRPPLTRALRPLAVLDALARRAQTGEGLLTSPISMLVALRVGMLGK